MGTDYTVAANRKGKDFYIYACEPSSGNTPVMLLSASSTYPAGYTADTSRKIGGFHCLCADVGTITGHPLSGFVAGDILPLSVWDLLHRPKSASPEGMVWCEEANIWVDIYSQSGTAARWTPLYATADASNVYERGSLPSIKGTSVAADRYTWQSPAGGLVVGINGVVYALTTQTELDLSNSAHWDTTSCPSLGHPRPVGSISTAGMTAYAQSTEGYSSCPNSSGSWGSPRKI